VDAPPEDHADLGLRHGPLPAGRAAEPDRRCAPGLVRLHQRPAPGQLEPEREFSEKAHATPYAALTYDINKTYSAYASYTSIFRPQDFLDVSGSMLAPVEGRNFELGLKGSYLDDRVNLAVAVFNTTQDNLPQAITDINSCTVKTNCYRSVGKVRSKGLMWTSAARSCRA
jgi:outer membrane receptor for ferric coprogen and ferric-rhodotorulic acid